MAGHSNINSWVGPLGENMREKENRVMHCYWGMHGYWWFFWILLGISFYSFLTPVRRSAYRFMQSPLQLLQRRYAAGEISSQEYEERRTKLQPKPKLLTS
jgi:putative membrane protein